MPARPPSWPLYDARLRTPAAEDLTVVRLLADRRDQLSRERNRIVCRRRTDRASSGDVRRHRLSRRGNHRLNAAIHMVALGQLSHPSAGRDYYDRNLAEGKTGREAAARPQTATVQRHLAPPGR